MITHYTLQTKDHKITLKELDFSEKEMRTIKFALKHYFTTLEGSYERLVLDEQLPEAAVPLRDALESVRQIRKKLDDR